ncbi:MAG TPA: dihydrolipoyllysine-residue acetyltransferase [Candidatus Baltobacteraceae bacterium]|nr:dihydrolipoyllysine-residue acetyltransferase [Candidatus Baltobacteraceae bacterium]
MAQATDVRVPDIGDFQDVPVIEVLVKPGDAIKKNDSLVTLESEKAAMEVPSPIDGRVQDVKVKIGDKVSEGSVILTLAAADAAAPPLRQSQGPTSHPDPSIPQGRAASKDAESLDDAQDRRRGAEQIVELKVPDIGDFKDVPVIEVLVKPGDVVAKDASLVVLESEKASMEVPATAAGTISDVRVKAGDKVSQGSVIATVQTTAVSAPVADAPRQARGPSIPQDDTASIPRRDTASIPQRDTTAATAPLSQSANGAVHASPSIRRFARELGVDLHTVHPTGPNGRVTREDVQHFVKRALQDGGTPTSAGATGLQIAPWPRVDFAQFGEIERKPLSRIKKISGPNLHRNWVMIPHVTQNDDADVTDLEEFRKELNAEYTKQGVKVTMLAFLIKASVAALKKFPDFNSSLDGDDVVYKHYYNIGFAADTPGGLVVPVVKNADAKGIAQLAQETAELAAKARDGKLSPADMQGGTFTISSLGSIGGTYFTPIINAPEVAILGACRAAIRPVWNGTEFAPRLVQPLSLSYDHRVIDGAAAARFTAYLASVLRDLRRALI